MILVGGWLLLNYLLGDHEVVGGFLKLADRQVHGAGLEALVLVASLLGNLVASGLASFGEIDFDATGDVEGLVGGILQDDIVLERLGAHGDVNAVLDALKVTGGVGLKDHTIERQLLGTLLRHEFGGYGALL